MNRRCDVSAMPLPPHRYVRSFGAVRPDLPSLPPSFNNRQQMRSFIQTVVFFLLAGTVHHLHAQSGTVAGRVVSAEGTEPIPGATILLAAIERGGSTDIDGRFLIGGIPPGPQSITVSSLGYVAREIEITIIAGDTLFVDVVLEPEESEEEEVVVTGTRTRRSIDDVPVRVEAVPQEEIEEKILMAPSSVALLLNESTGMRMQTTSPTTSSANLRIQGLPGRYTQILTDGIPNVGGLAAGFGLTELPPLNLRQVEIIKGAASALYGADAIAGVVNFITKDPRQELEVSALVNVTSQRGFDLAGYVGKDLGDLGFTLMATRNTQSRHDVDDDGFADVPAYERYTIYPKIVADLSETMRLDIALGLIADERLGGAVSGERQEGGSDAPYLESTSSTRFSGTVHWSWDIAEEKGLSVKGAGLALQRDALYGIEPFNASQRSAYGEAQYTTTAGRHSLLAAGVISLDDFTDETPDVDVDRSYRYVVPGLLAQDEFRISETLTLLGSGRVDFHNAFGTFVTPRLSIMVKPSPSLTIRAGGGTGFKAPTIFVEEAEERGFRQVRLADDVRAETSQNGSLDLNWRGSIGPDIGVSINAVGYLTRLRHALIADATSPESLLLRNATGSTISRGAELTTRFSYTDVKLSLGYTLLHTTQTDSGTTVELPLNPRHALGVVVMWESEEAGMKVGFETYWTGRQRLEDHPTRDASPSYVIMGLLVEKAIGPIRLFINFENFLDTRQTRFEPIIIGNPALGPVTTLPIYAPLDGRVINGGVRFVLP